MIKKVNGEQEDFQRNATHDLIKLARSQSSNFNIAWLKGGARLSNSQRVGFLIFSLFFVLIGITFLMNCRDSFYEHDFLWGMIWGMVAVFFLTFGGLGLRNLFRRHTPKQD